MNLESELLEQRGALVAYLLAKIRAEDWHAVQDAASDIREVNAKLELLASLDRVAPLKPAADYFADVPARERGVGGNR